VQTTYLLNGQPLVSSQSGANHFGDGLFETIAIRQGRPCLWQYHLDRLHQGCLRLGFPVIEVAQLTAEVQQLCHSRPRAVLKIILSTGDTQRGYQRAAGIAPNRFVQCHPWPDSPLYQTPSPSVSLQLCQTRLGCQPLLAGIKHLNRLEQILARKEIQPPAVEGVMLNQQGQVVEGTMSNVLLWRAGTYLTPPIVDCGIAGVVRQFVLDQAVQQNQTVHQEVVSLAMLRQADALFILNSLLGVRQVVAVGEHVYPSVAMPTFLQRIHQACFIPN